MFVFCLDNDTNNKIYFKIAIEASRYTFFSTIGRVHCNPSQDGHKKLNTEEFLSKTKDKSAVYQKQNPRWPPKGKLARYSNMYCQR